MAGIRIDKWLWAVRIFKTRSLSGKECRNGKVSINEKTAKPSSEVTVGDVIRVKKNGYNYQFKVEKVIGKRVGAPLAVECYQDLTPEEELKKFDSWYIGKAGNEQRDKGSGRPTKKERREIDEFKEFSNYFDDVELD